MLMVQKQMKMINYSEDEILELIIQKFTGKKKSILSCCEI